MVRTNIGSSGNYCFHMIDKGLKAELDIQSS